jgi:hypothetical protein
MGETLHAIVEVHLPAVGDLVRAHWDDVCSWEFGKDYDLSGWLWKHANRGWPEDVGFGPRYERDERGADTGLQWCPVEVVREAERVCCNALLTALSVALCSLVTSYAVRVLWYRM